MSRQNVNTQFKFGDTDGFMLTDLDTSETLMLTPCDTAGNFSWTGVTRAPLTRNAMKTSNTSNQYSDLEPPWISIPQENWSGGRGNMTFTKDTTRYLDGKRAQAAFNECIYNGPLDHYSTGFRKAITNCPGSVSWKKLNGADRYIAVEFSTYETFEPGEIYIHLRRRGTPTSALTVELKDNLTGNVLASHDFTTAEITDTLSEFAKFTFEGVTLNARQKYYICVHSDSSATDNRWEVGISKKFGNTYSSSSGTNYNLSNYELYYRIAETQTGYRTLFFQYEQIPFMIRQKIGEAPTLWINGWIGKATGIGSDSISDSTRLWNGNDYKGARVGLIYHNGSEEHTNTWRTIKANSADTLTVDTPWDITPIEGVTYVIVDTPIWTEITGHELTTYVTDVEVINGIVYFAQGDYTDVRKMRWHDGSFEWKTLTNTQATFLQSVRDTTAMMLYRGRNDGINHKRTIERSLLLDWDSERSIPTFDEETDYVTGDYVYYEDVLYRFTADHAAGAWSSREVEDMTIEPEEEEYTPPDDPTGTIMTIIKTAVTPSDGVVVTDSVDFDSCDYDTKLYVVDITTLTSDKNTGSFSITLQQSEDDFAWSDVKTVNCTNAGRWYIEAHCDYRYRRLKYSASGSNCSVNNVTVKTSDIPHFVDPIILQDNFGKITRLFEYGAEQTKSLWIAQEGMISSVNKVDGTTDTYTHDRINLDELQTTAEMWNGKAMTTADVYLLWGWLNGLQRYYNTQIEGKGPDHDEGLPFDRQGRVSQIISYPSNFFISIDAEDGYSSVMQFNQSGWHEIYRAPNKGERIFDMGFQPIYGPRPDRLWLNVGDDVVWLSMPSKILYAIQDQYAEYTHESVLVSAWHTAGMTDIEKLWQTMKIMADYLDGKNCWIEADYQTDEEEIWHPIENWYTVSPSHKEDLNPSGSVNGKKLRYRLRLQTTDYHKTPKVNVVVLEAVGRVDIKMSYNFYFRNIKYKRDLNAEFEDLEPLDMQDLLDRWANDLKKLRMNSRWRIFDDKIVYLDAVQTSVLNELSEGYIGQITLNEL